MKTHQIKLIDSTYSEDDAFEVLSSLIKDKIRFLNHKIFSLEERFGSDTSHMKKRIEELRQEARDLELLFEEHRGENVDFEISCNLTIAVHASEVV